MSTIRFREGLRDERVHPAHLRVVQRLCGVVLDGHVGHAVGRAIASSGLVAAGRQPDLGVAHPDLRGLYVARAPALSGMSPERAGARAGRQVLAGPASELS
jgi:hypothetical protein